MISFGKIQTKPALWVSFIKSERTQNSNGKKKNFWGCVQKTDCSEEFVTMVKKKINKKKQ